MKSTSCSSHSCDQPLIVRLCPAFVADVEPRQIELLGQTAARFAVADHQPRLGLHLPVADRPQQRQRRLRPIRDADRQPRLAAGDVGRPGADRELRPPRDVGHRVHRALRNVRRLNSTRVSIENTRSSSWSYIWISAMFAPRPVTL